MNFRNIPRCILRTELTEVINRLSPSSLDEVASTQLLM